VTQSCPPAPARPPPCWRRRVCAAPTPQTVAPSRAGRTALLEDACSFSRASFPWWVQPGGRGARGTGVAQLPAASPPAVIAARKQPSHSFPRVPRCPLTFLSTASACPRPRPCRTQRPGWRSSPCRSAGRPSTCRPPTCAGGDTCGRGPDGSVKPCMCPALLPRCCRKLLLASPARRSYSCYLSSFDPDSANHGQYCWLAPQPQGAPGTQCPIFPNGWLTPGAAAAPGVPRQQPKRALLLAQRCAPALVCLQPQPLTCLPTTPLCRPSL
jgi:hypothetical protein